MNIRSSMLPSFADCPRRTMAKQYRRTFEKLGYEFRELPPSVGAAAGTAVHKGCEILLRKVWERHTPANLDDAVSAAISDFREETGRGATWDETTPNANVAETQIRRMVEAYPIAMPMTVNDQPAVELSLDADCGDGWKLTGHIDLIDDGGNVRDTKTGAITRPYFGQLGAYSLLVRSNGIMKKVGGLCIDFIKRVGKTKPQPPCETTEYAVSVCERNAMGLIKRIKADMDAFERELNPEVFMANPMSMMCEDKYCPAWGTKFCNLTTQKG